MKNIKILLLAMLFITLTGCATIVSDSEYPVQFESSPTKATCSIEGKNYNKVITTPDNVIISTKSAPLTVRCENNGQMKEEIITTGLDPWLFGNIFFGWGGIIGLIVDPLTGSAQTLPEHVMIDFDETNEIIADENNALIEE